MVPLVSAYLEHFTYAGLFAVLLLCGLGLPLPEDVALLAGGYLAYRGIIRLPLTLPISLLGVVSGDLSLFFLGRHLGTGLVRYFGLLYPHARRRIASLQGFMHRHGHRAIFYARFLPGLRALVYLSAGSLEVTPRVFLVYDLSGALISVPIVVTLGYMFGNQLDTLARYAGGLEQTILVVAGLSVAVWLWRWLVPLRTHTQSSGDSRANAQ